MNTYLDYYNQNFATKIQEIDLFLKADEEDRFSYDTVTELLDISAKEIDELMTSCHLEEINLLSFFVFMQNGSSPICKLFSRELQRKMPHFYSFYDISYIYQIPYERVVEGAQRGNINSITSANIHDLFGYIPLAS